MLDVRVRESGSTVRVAIGALILTVVVIGGAIGVIVLIGGMTPIHVTESAELGGLPDTPQQLVDRGATLFVTGVVATVHEPEWNTSGQERPRTPWDISRVPEEYWIHTPVTLRVSGPVIILDAEEVERLDFDPNASELLFVVRGGEIDNDRYAIEDGFDREFDEGEEVAIVLSVIREPETLMHSTSHGPAWEYARKYSLVDNDTVVLVWGEDQYEYDLADMLQEFTEAAD
jgi:hypothetical protein